MPLWYTHTLVLYTKEEEHGDRTELPRENEKGKADGFHFSVRQEKSWRNRLFLPGPQLTSSCFSGNYQQAQPLTSGRFWIRLTFESAVTPNEDLPRPILVYILCATEPEMMAWIQLDLTQHDWIWELWLYSNVTATNWVHAGLTVVNVCTWSGSTYIYAVMRGRLVER